MVLGGATAISENIGNNIAAVDPAKLTSSVADDIFQLAVTCKPGEICNVNDVTDADIFLEPASNDESIPADLVQTTPGNSDEQAAWAIIFEENGRTYHEKVVFAENGFSDPDNQNSPLGDALQTFHHDLKDDDESPFESLQDVSVSDGKVLIIDEDGDGEKFFWVLVNKRVVAGELEYTEFDVCLAATDVEPGDSEVRCAST